MSKSKTKTVNIVSDLKQIIKVQEKIIDRKENEFQLVHSLFLHYLDKSDEYMTKLQYYHNLWLKSEFVYHEFVIKIMKGGFKHD